MSIFGKDCPRCGETNAAYAVSCRCGFAFNSVEHVEEEEQDISVTIQEEELYLEYLRARAQQATENAKRAAAAAAEQPANKVAASQSQQAQLAAEQANTELEQQRARMKVAMHTLADDNVAKQELPANNPPARPQPAAASPSPAIAPAKSATTPPVIERKEPAPVAAKPPVTPPPVKREEPAPAAVKSAAPAATGSEATPPATAKTPQDLNNYIPRPDNARATTATNSTGQATGCPSHSQPRIPAGHPVRPETKTQASAPAPASKVVPPIAKANAPQAVPTRTENPSANKQSLAGSTSATTRPAPSGHKDVSAGAQVPRGSKPVTQGDTASNKAAAAARAKQLAEALKAAQTERAARSKTSAATPNLGHNDGSKADQAKPTGRGVNTDSAKTVPAPSRTPKPATPAVGVTTAKSVNGQQQKLNGHDKPSAGINAIHIPGTEAQDNKPKSDAAVAKQAIGGPATVAKQPGAAAVKSASDSGTPKINGAPRPMADSEGAAAKPGSDVSVTVTTGANPQEELEAALQALSLRAPTPSTPDPTDVRDTGAASPEVGNSPAPTAAPTRTLDELPSLESVTSANQKDCPNCTASLPMEAKRCRCGFRFPEIEETMPGLSLSDSDVAALDGDAPSTGITHLS